MSKNDDAIQKLFEAIGEINGKLDGIDDKFNSVSSENRDNRKDIEDIKIVMAKYTGVIIALSTLCGIIWAVLGSYLKAKLAILLGINI